MPNLALSPTGLLMAASCSISNVMTDVARKHALERRDLIPATFWIRVVVAALFGIALLWRIVNGATVVIRDGGALFGIAALHPAPIPEFLIYLLIDVSLITIVMWLYFRALQISPLSMSVPFLSFTPVFLIATGFIIRLSARI
jgi:drug/metabolite transporter (DMT)-like permease